MKKLILLLFLISALNCYGQGQVKISALPALGEAPATGDILALTDISANVTKKVTVLELLRIGASTQAYDADLTTYAGITPSANIQSLLASADYAAARTNLGLVIGTNVQAYDADLTTYGGITPSANIQSLLGSADYAAARTNLGLVIGTNVQAYDADLTTYAGITPAADMQSFLAAANDAAARTALGVSASITVAALPANGILAVNTTYYEDALATTDTWTLPSSPAEGDVIYVDLLNAAATTITFSTTLPFRTLETTSTSTLVINPAYHQIRFTYSNAKWRMSDSAIDTETANLIYAGPVSGGAAVPTFRAMVAADIAADIVDGAALADTLTLDANLVVTGAFSHNYGNNLATTVTIDTDGTGDAELVVPDGSISSTEILDATIALADLSTAAKQERTVGITVDGAGSVLTTGNKGLITAPVTGTITSWALSANASGNITFDVEKAAADTVPSTSIVASAPPTMTADQLAASSTLTGWTTSVTKGEVIEFEITGTPATITRCTLQLYIQP